jgi:hypothetical protein
MADAVDLVRAYLHVNGYFTVTEYPVLEQRRGGGYRTVTDLDVLAFRFTGAGPVPVTSGPGPLLAPTLPEPDAALGRRRGESDMIVAEVKEGQARLNRAARDPRVLEAALVRFGCCEPAEAEQVVATLLREGEASTGHGHRVRLLAFGSTVPDGGPGGFTTISLGHVLSFLRTHLRDHWDLVQHAQMLDPALGFLSLIEKAERGTEPP